MTNIKLDCRHFSGDKPCRFHKEEGVTCGICDQYAPIGYKVLIIKLGAPGDVVRTTPVLRELHKTKQQAHITWITDIGSLPIIENNPFIDRLWDRSVETLSRLHTEEFDRVLSLDNSGDCASLASLARGRKKQGFGINSKGSIVPFNREAEQWLEMAAFDDVKKANKRTYQDIIFEICGYRFNPDKHGIVLNLREEEKLVTKKFALDNGLKREKMVVGLNIGAGRRWKMKRWTSEGFMALAERLVYEDDVQVVLLGGPDETEMAEKIKSNLKGKGVRIIDSGCRNTLRNFIAIIDACDVVVTGDTLAMHIAIGLGKKVMTFFGPTSAAEIELYGRGVKITADKDCTCCYRQQCDANPYCVESITISQMYDAVRECMNNRSVNEVNSEAMQEQKVMI
jgi:heptosyltransferase-2